MDRLCRRRSSRLVEDEGFWAEPVLVETWNTGLCAGCPQGQLGRLDQRGNLSAGRGSGAPGRSRSILSAGWGLASLVLGGGSGSLSMGGVVWASPNAGESPAGTHWRLFTRKVMPLARPIAVCMRVA